MANFKRRRDEDHDSQAPKKKKKTNTAFTITDFMADFPPLKGPMVTENESPLPSTVLADAELQDVSNGRKPPYRSTFNVTMPLQLDDYDEEAALNAPYNWMKNQYAHCIIPELGEEYDFDFDSETFHTLRDIHNARARIRDGMFLPDYLVLSLASRWILLEEKDRPTSDGYPANGDIFVATCLPLNNDDDAVKTYFERKYSRELSASHYIPLSKYSVHFVGEPNMTQSKEIQSVHVGSVLIRNTRTGNVIHIDTGTPNTRAARAARAGKVLKSWLEFQEEKRPDADLGPISASAPFVLDDVEKETHPTLRSISALVSASLFLRRRITNWGDMKAFMVRGKPTSKTMANYALHNITGWLGLKSSKETVGQQKAKTIQSFENNYLKGGLMGRQQPAPVSKRIRLAKKGEPAVYNDEADSDDEASDQGGSLADSSHESASGNEDTIVVAQSSDGDNDDDDDDDDELPDDEAQPTGGEGSDDGEPADDEPANNQSATNESAKEDPVNDGPANDGPANDKPANDESAKKVSPKKVSFSFSIEPEDSEESEDENPKTAEAQNETVVDEDPKKKRTSSEEPTAKESDIEPQAEGNGCDRNHQASA